MKKLLILFLMVMSLSAKAQSYHYSPFIILANKHDMVISGDSINGGGHPCIYLISCQRIKIINCKLQNSTEQGVKLDGCTDIQVLNNFITNTSDGVYAKNSKQIKVNYNQIYKIVNTLNYSGRGCGIQFVNVSGPGNQINYNKYDNPIGAGTNPNPQVGDDINLYGCHGVASSPIEIIGNWIRGGGTGITGSASKWAGIVLGDVDGSYQKAAFNILVNTGYAGIQYQSGNNITIVGNMIFSSRKYWSGLGLGSANYSLIGVAKNNTVGGNLVNWFAGVSNIQAQRDTVYKPHDGTYANERPRTWNSNHPLAPIDSTILPLHFITGH